MRVVVLWPTAIVLTSAVVDGSYTKVLITRAVVLGPTARVLTSAVAVWSDTKAVTMDAAVPGPITRGIIRVVEAEWCTDVDVPI